jgi:glutathione synthase
MATAFKEYSNINAQVLFVVQDNEWNIMDQRHIEFHLWEKYSIKVLRKSLIQIYEEGKLTSNRELFVGDVEIAVIYYRAGYSPKEYPTDKEWSARRMMELSRASSSPSISYHLAGCKKIQQLLSVDGVLEKYCSDPVAVAKMRQTFTKLYPTDNSVEGERAVRLAMEQPELYVLKPQREGGGNNIFGASIPDYISTLGPIERSSHILMEKINSPSFHNGILKRGTMEVIEDQFITELGIFGVYVRRGDDVLVNSDGGYLIRIKPKDKNEGGVSVGVAAISSLTLTSSDTYLNYCLP